MSSEAETNVTIGGIFVGLALAVLLYALANLFIEYGRRQERQKIEIEMQIKEKGPK